MRTITFIVGAIAFGLCAILMIGLACATAAILRRVFAPRCEIGDLPDTFETIGYDDNDPGVDVDA